MPHALVTGGTRGIGAGIVHALVNAGWTVTATGLTLGGGPDFAARQGVKTRTLDVTRDDQVAALIADTPSLDLLVNCAGIIQHGGAEFTLDAFKLTLEVNLVGTMRMCVAARQLLAASGGSIVNLASALTFRGWPSSVPGYAASKGGIGQLTKCLAGAWAAEGVRVNAIAPGWIATDLTRPLVENSARSARILARTPQGRWGTPDDVGGVVVFLASDAARFVTGAILPIDGGYLAM